VFNYYFDVDRDFHQDTVDLFDAINNNKCEAFTSEYVIMELRNAKEPKRSRMLSLIDKHNAQVFDINAESVRLANVYVQKGVIPERFRLDAIHIAIASVHNLDFVISFNFKHINKIKTKNMTALINIEEGYKPVMICTPMEVL
jgi:predicted nucleic acid-binding protein